MIRSTTHPQTRPGFTLVELMVAAAVCVLIMAVLATAFQLSIDTMRHMKSTGDLASQLRASGEVLRRDLQAEHYLPDESRPNRGVRVSDLTAGQSPAGGYFVIRSTPISGVQAEGADSDGFNSTRATDHSLEFTSVLPGTAGQHLYTTLSPAVSGTTYSKRIAELGYFLADDPATPGNVTDRTAPPANQIPLKNLLRRQRLVAVTDSDKTTLPKDSDVVATDTAGTTVLDLKTLTPGNRMALAPFPIPSTRFGDDILLSNVISFEVRVCWATSTTPAGTEFTDNSDHPFNTLPGTLTPASTFDSSNAPNMRVLAVQIRLRVWDPKLKTTRQMTIVQEL